MENHNQLVARNVRRYRQERALSLGDLARRAGLSKQTVSKIEQGTGNPTVDTLTQLGAAMNISPRRLLTEWGSPVLVNRHSDTVGWESEKHWSTRTLDEVFGSGSVRTSLLRLKRETEFTVREPQSQGTLHHMYAIEGLVSVGPVEDPVEIGVGDFVRFPGDVVHQYFALSAHALIHVVTTVPHVRQFDPIIP
ncbi:DNA-binding protein [Rhodococcus sp. KBW08]|uniref:helix-turn-helix domain-containing protein n=1 Tax=Rhodococcus sp. KBW08 TaxID=2144188 RepID=UPI000F599522|nr:helix-turn-helix transcriptional regulator [Rhodococcus sp. KBW08]RQO46080.1 DNA-binding protein [Rhodococcus sp. KBW08]